MPITTTTQSNTFNITPVSATDHYTGFLCSASTYNLLGTTTDSFTNLETISDSISTLAGRTSYTSIVTNSLVDKEIHSIQRMDCIYTLGCLFLQKTSFSCKKTES